MKVIKREKSQLVLRFERGEEYPEVFVEFLKKEKVRGGFFFGLGAFQNPRVAYFNFEKKKYIERMFRGMFEVLSLVGNVAYRETDAKFNVKQREIVIHNHVVLGDKNYRAIGGHLVRGVVGGTLELYFMKTRALRRSRDKSTGLNLLA